MRISATEGNKDKENRKFVMEQREFVHPVLAEANTKCQELQWGKMGYFIMNGPTQGNGKLMLKSLNFPTQGSGLAFKGLGGTGG